jgi:hypothetical protein
MVFAISYSLLGGQLSRERVWPSVLRLCNMYHRNIFDRVRNLLIIKILLLVAAPPSPLRPRQLPWLPTPRPGSDLGYRLQVVGNLFLFHIGAVLIDISHIPNVAAERISLAVTHETRRIRAVSWVCSFQTLPQPIG